MVIGRRTPTPAPYDFSNQGDVISSLDRNATQVERGTIKPVEAHKFDNMTTQGSFEQGVDNRAQVEQQINQNDTNEQITYNPQEELILSGKPNKLSKIIEEDMKNKDYYSIKPMLEDK